MMYKNKELGVQIVRICTILRGKRHGAQGDRHHVSMLWGRRCAPQNPSKSESKSIKIKNPGKVSCSDSWGV